MIFVPNIRILN